jgi:transketolase
MGLEDIALFRTLPGSTVFYPSDAVSCERAVELAANTFGICFIRTSRPAMPTVYANDAVFEVGKAKVVRESSNDQCVIVGAGVTLLEALSAADTLSKQNVNVCVIDPFTIKPLDVETLRKHVKRCGNRIITVEDHYHEGGIGEAVASCLLDDTASMGAVRMHRIAVDRLPRSGPPDALMDMFGLSARHIVDAVLKIVK